MYLSKGEIMLDKNMSIRGVDIVGPREHYPHNGCMKVYWQSERGFGEYTLIKNMDGSLTIDNECDSIEKVKQAFCMALDSATKVD